MRFKKFDPVSNKKINADVLQGIFRGIKSVSSTTPIHLIKEFCDNLAGSCGLIMSCLSSQHKNHDDFRLKKIVLSELNRALNVSIDISLGLDGIRNSHLKMLSVGNKLALLVKYNKIMNTCRISSNLRNFQNLEIFSLIINSALDVLNPLKTSSRYDNGLRIHSNNFNDDIALILAKNYYKERISKHFIPKMNNDMIEISEMITSFFTGAKPTEKAEPCISNK
uniref:Uncharacterized protein n=1 Tax=Glossina brevipalpis TaxID=37001 RepID=A0A1A9WLT6_9MUSC